MKPASEVMREARERRQEFRETFRVGTPWSRFFSAMWRGFGISWNLYGSARRSVELRARRLLIRFALDSGRRSGEQWRTVGFEIQIVWFDRA